MMRMKERERELERPLKAVANRRRLAILKYLKRRRDVPVGEIADAIEASFKATSKHLAILFAMEIVERKQVGFESHYRLADDQKPVIRGILSQL